jgi:hypothetical protein
MAEFSLLFRNVLGTERKPMIAHVCNPPKLHNE